MSIDPDKLSELRRNAQERVNSEISEMHADPQVAAVLEELNIFQAELEAQFEEAQQNEVKAQHQADRFEQLFNFAPVGYVVLDRSSVIIQSNNKAKELLQLDTRLQEPRISYLDFAANDLLSYLNWLESKDTEVVLELREPRRWLRLTKAVMPDGELLVAVTDISPRRKAEQALITSERRLRVSFDLSPLAILMSHPSGAVLDANRAFCELVGIPLEELKAQNVVDLSPVSASPNQQIVPIIEKRARTASHEALITQGDGSVMPVRVSSQLIAGEDSEEVIWSVLEDISLYKAQIKELESKVYLDDLTQLPNRGGFNKHVQLAFQRALSSQLDLVILYIDLDGFKLINDNHGHDVGDALLIETAKRMKKTLRASDTIARLGGDEFAAVLVDIGDTEAELDFLLSRLLDVISVPVQLGSVEVRVSASIGGAIYSQEERRNKENLDLLLHDADKAMYRAKAKGKGTYVLHGAT